MKPVVKKNIAVFKPKGFLDGNNAPYIITHDDLNYLATLKQIDAVIISLEKVIFFNKNGLSMLMDLLRDIESENGVIIGFSDCDYKKFQTIIKIFENHIDFCLFETFEIATFLIYNDKKNDKKILLWNDESDQKHILAVELFERGYSPAIAKNFDEFQSKKANFEVCIEKTFLNLYHKKIITKMRENSIVYILREYIDSNVSKAFDFNYHMNSLKVGFKLFVFDAAHVTSVNIHGVNFLTKLMTSSSEHNAVFAIAGLDDTKITQPLKENLEDVGILFYNSVNEIFLDKDMMAEAMQYSTLHQKNVNGITKSLISHLPTFTEAAIYTIEIMSQIKAEKKAVNIQQLQVDILQTYYVSTIGFYGMTRGMIILVFPKKLIKKSCALLLDEENDDESMLLDALGEFANIIGGKTKSMLAKKSVKIDITLPRTFESVDTFLELQGEKKGVQIDFEFNDEPFYFFLTNSN